MSYTVYDSTSARTSSTTQDLLNDLAAQWDGWHSVEYNTPGDSASGVATLYVTSKISLSKDSSSTPKLQAAHSTSGQSVAFGAVITKYKIVVSEYGVLMAAPTVGGGLCFAVGTTTDTLGTTGKGLVTRNGSSSNVHTIFTDHMTLDTSSIALSNSSRTGSNALTQLAPVCSISGDEIFTGVYFVIVGKETDNGPITFGGKKYYLINTQYSMLALEFS